MKSNLSGSALRLAISLAALAAPTFNPGQSTYWGHDSAVAQSADVSEKEAFEAAKSLGTVEAWDAFLSNFPKGFHADLARAYVKQLAAQTKPAPAPASPPPAAILQAAYEQVCEGQKGLRSRESNESAKIRFINESGTTLVIQWIDFKGALKEYGVLQPGAEMTQETFITHPWIAAYQEGSCRQIFLPAPGLSVARLLPEDQLPKKASHTEDAGDHGPTPEQTCKDIGQDYNGSECVPRKKNAAQPSKATIERRAKAACVDIGMIYLNGKCAPKTKAERNAGANNKNKPCPAGMYRNPYGKCQPNETGG